MTVEEFFRVTEHPLKKEMIALRKIIRDSVPELTEQIKWNAPSFCHEGDDRITFNVARKNSVLLIFHRGAKAKKVSIKKPILERNAELLDWPAPDRAVLTISSSKDLKDLKGALTEIVSDWIKTTAKYAA